MNNENAERIIGNMDSFDIDVMNVVTEALGMTANELLYQLELEVKANSEWWKSIKIEGAKLELDDIGARRRAYDLEKHRLLAAADMKDELSARAEDGYLAVIRSLTMALADAHPDTLKPDGIPFVGYAKDTGSKGIVGHLIGGKYSDRSSRDLEKKIGDAIKRK